MREVKNFSFFEIVSLFIEKYPAQFFTKKTLEADKTVGDITYKANGDIYYTVNGTPTKIGERYELVVTGLETEDGVGYSGAMTMSFPAGVITDKSNNSNIAKTITIGIDEPENPAFIELFIPGLRAFII